MQLFAVVDLCSGAVVAGLMILAYVLFVQQKPKDSP